MKEEVRRGSYVDDLYDEPGWQAALAGLGHGRYRLDALRAGLRLIEEALKQGDQDGDAWEFLQRCTLRPQAMLRDGVTPLILLMNCATDVPLHRRVVARRDSVEHRPPS